MLAQQTVDHTLLGISGVGDCGMWEVGSSSWHWTLHAY